MTVDNSRMFDVQKAGLIDQRRPDSAGWAEELSAEGRGAKVLIWAAAILFFGFGDTLTSLMVFANGGVEGNLLLRAVLSFLGPTLWSFVAIKMAATLGIVLLALLVPRMETLISLGMLAAGVFLVTHNSMLL